MAMGRKRVLPKLRLSKGKYYCTDIYLPNGKRSTIGFGTMQDRSYGEIMVAFGRWVDLYQAYPNRVLSFNDPYDAVKEMVNPSKCVAVGDLLTRFGVYARKTTAEVQSNKEHPDFVFIRRVEQFLKPYRDWPVKEFGPDELFDVQQALLDYTYDNGKAVKSYTRRGVNDTINWVRKIWRWGMGRGMVTTEQVQGIEEVKALRIGNSKALDNTKRKRVTEREFNKVIKHVNSVVGDMLKLVWHTGMRPNEVCSMRPFDIIRDDDDCWLYIPGRDLSPVGKHKTMRFEKVKVIPLTKESQKILKQRITDFNSKEYLFSPQESMQEFLAKKAESRKTPLNQGNRPGTNRKEHPMIKARDHYDHHTFRRACRRACVRAVVDPFVPYDLRRSMATRARATLGKEAAKVLLGHSSTSTTEIYLLEEVQEAMKVAKALSS
jgi:integrase